MTGPVLYRGLKRLGLLGGSFDPVHVGHLHVARSAQARFGLDHVLWVPAARPPHKPDRVLAEGADRLAMVELAIRGEPTWSASDLELRRRGVSYTMETVRALEAELDLDPDAGIWLVIGSDNLEGLPEWAEVEELLARVHPIVVYRGTPAGLGEAEARTRSLLAGRLSPVAIDRVVAGLLDVPPVDVSSTSLRARIAAGEDVGDELPPEVWEYVRARGIYGCPR